jgi:hypothetical protein
MIPGNQLSLGSLIVYIVSYYRIGLSEDISPDFFYPILVFSIIYATMLFPVSNMLIDYFNNQSKPVIVIVASIGLSL